MILEGIATTTNADGSANVAPMGPRVDRDVTELSLRPFQSSTTFQNLRRHPFGVFHVVDDARLLARAAIGVWETIPETFPAKTIPGFVLASCCRWYEFEVREVDDSEPRARIAVQIVHRGRLRDFFGWNRAKHAVLEAAILATRVQILSEQEILDQLDPLETIVGKTAGDQEIEAFHLLKSHIESHFAKAGTP